MVTPLGIDQALDALIACVSDALLASGAPVCAAFSTVGTPIISLACACKIQAVDENGEPVTLRGEGALAGRLVSTFRADKQSLQQTQTRRPCDAGQWAARFALTISRCYPTIDQKGNLPSPAAQSAAATKLHADTATLKRAVSCCGVGAIVETVSVEVDPSGGVSSLVAMVLVPVSMAVALNPR